LTFVAPRYAYRMQICTPVSLFRRSLGPGTPSNPSLPDPIFVGCLSPVAYPCGTVFSLFCLPGVRGVHACFSPPPFFCVPPDTIMCAYSFYFCRVQSRIRTPVCHTKFFPALFPEPGLSVLRETAVRGCVPPLVLSHSPCLRSLTFTSFIIYSFSSFFVFLFFFVSLRLIFFFCPVKVQLLTLHRRRFEICFPFPFIFSFVRYFSVLHGCGLFCF